jgi:hypothetical protein
MNSLKALRILSIITVIALLVIAAGFFFQAKWAVLAWPWPAGKLTFLFLSSIAAAIAAPFLWVTLSEEWGAMRGSGIFPFVTSAGFALFLFQQYRAGATTSLLWAIAGPAALFSLMLVLAGRHFALRDSRRQPPFLRFSFALFAIVLSLAGGALVFRKPNVMPWPINPEGGVICGWIFLGASTSYIYGFIHPDWHYARGPLLGFLVYDLILLPPLLLHFDNVKPEHHTSLIIYSAVLIYSGTLAIFQLFIAKSTRSWRTQLANESGKRNA